MSAVAVPPELWSAFDDDLESLIEGNQAADESYTAGKGMSLASMAVGSVAMRLTKVRAMAQNRDLAGTKTTLEKATVKIREAAFTSAGDPEGVTLGANLEILASLVGVLDRMENPTSKVKAENRDTSRTRAASVAKRNDKGGVRGETPEAAEAVPADDRAIGGVYRDLGIIEPDDDPLSCLADEEDSAGGGRPKMRFLVAPVDPKLAAKEKKLYWGNDRRRHLAQDYSATTSSLLGGGRQHARALQEALLHVQDQDCPVSPPAVDSCPVLSPISTTTETATKPPSLREEQKSGEPKEMVAANEADKPVEPKEDEERKSETFGLDPAMTDTLRKQLRQGAKDDYWPSMEEQGERWADAGNLSASCSAYSEASELFRICSDQLPSEPESLLRQWVTSRRAREVGYTAATPDVQVLRRCIKMCMGNDGSLSEGVVSDEGRPGTCNNPVCYEAHLELVAVLLERAQFKRCIKACRHVLDKHDDDDAETLFSLAQALEALGLSEEARKYESRASSLLATTS